MSLSACKLVVQKISLYAFRRQIWAHSWLLCSRFPTKNKNTWCCLLSVPQLRRKVEMFADFGQRQWMVQPKTSHSTNVGNIGPPSATLAQRYPNIGSQAGVCFVSASNTRHWPNVVLKLAHRLRRRPSIKTALDQCLVFAGSLVRRRRRLVRPALSFDFLDFLVMLDRSEKTGHFNHFGPMPC